MWLEKMPYEAENFGPNQRSSRDVVQNKPFEFEGVQSILSVRFATSNAKQMALYLQHVFGLEKLAFQGLENGNVLLSTHVLRMNDVVFEIMTSLETPMDTLQPRVQTNSEGTDCKQNNFGTEKETIIMDILGFSDRQRVLEALRYHSVRKLTDKLNIEDKEKLRRYVVEANVASAIDRFVALHGMGVFDIVLAVKNIRKLVAKAASAGAVIISHPEVSKDEQGSVIIATIKTPFSDLRHTLIENLDYIGPYLPNYGKSTVKDNSFETLSVISEFDHCVLNFTWNELATNAKFYISAFGFHKFWSVDDSDVSTENSGLRSIVLSNFNGKVLMPMNEPAKSKMRGQIEEFYDFYGGSGVQHIALKTDDIISTVLCLKTKGLEFNTVSENYYLDLEKRLLFYKIELHEPFEVLKELQILADFDPNTRFKQKNGKFHCHYILQIFSKPVHDRPTFFFELIQRHNHHGFGKGTFKGLFESIEEQQKLRGTLVPVEEEITSEKHKNI